MQEEDWMFLNPFLVSWLPYNQFLAFQQSMCICVICGFIARLEGILATWKETELLRCQLEDPAWRL
jgi:hypothetical protein